MKMEQIERSETSILHTSYPAYEDGTDSVPKRRYFILHIQPMKMEQIECSETSILHISYPAYEDGTDRVFRNVGKPQSDAGEIPKRILKRFKTRRNFEIKNNSDS